MTEQLFAQTRLEAVVVNASRRIDVHDAVSCVSGTGLVCYAMLCIPVDRRDEVL